MSRFQEVQRIGVRKEKESIERARVASYQSLGGNDSQSGSDLHSSYNQFQQQQQMVSSMDEQAILLAINERADRLRQLEVHELIVVKKC